MQRIPDPSDAASSSDAGARVLWTGGWDSTYRVAQLCMAGEPVQPHYLVDPYRDSLTNELRAMEAVRRQIVERGWTEPVPTRLVLASAVPPVEGVRSAFSDIRQSHFIGSQYVSLAEYAYAIGGIEIAVHEDDVLTRLLAPSEPLAEEVAWAVNTLCAHFRTPLLRETKVGMRDAAERGGFSDVMNLTWFCHQPRNGKPCGVCGPCKYTIQEGLGDRVPFAGRARQVVASMARRGRSA